MLFSGLAVLPSAPALGIWSPTCPASTQGSILAHNSSFTKCRHREELPTTLWCRHAGLLIFPSPPHSIRRFSHSICRTGPAYEIQKNAQREMSTLPNNKPTQANETAAPNRRRRFTFPAWLRFDHWFRAQRPLPAAVGEPRRWAKASQV